MLIYLAFAGLILLLPVAGLFPLVEWRGVTVENRIFSIEMRPRRHPKYGDAGQRFRPVFAQELVEWYVAWLGALLLALPVAIGLHLAGAGMLTALAIPAAMIAWNWRKTDWGRRQLEYIGWSAEMIMAERQDYDGYQGFDFVDTLRRGYAVFDGMSNDDVAAGLGRWRGLASLLLALLALRIRRAA